MNEGREVEALYEGTERAGFNVCTARRDGGHELAIALPGNFWIPISTLTNPR